jgi:UDP-glucose 4-epimerase
MSLKNNFNPQLGATPQHSELKELLNQPAGTGFRNKSILVTGGAGFIGSHLIDALIKEGPEEIIALCNFSLGKEENLREALQAFPKLKIIKASLANFDECKKVFEENNVDVVFNLAVVTLLASLEKPAWSVKENMDMITTICELQRLDKFQRLIHFSSSEAYGTAQFVPMTEGHPLVPETPYAAAKAAADHVVGSYARTFKTDSTVVRPFNNYGPRQHAGKYAAIIPLTVRRIMAGEPITINGDGNQTRDFIFVKDTADAAIQIAKSKSAAGKTINVASGRETTMNRVVELISQELGYNGNVEHREARPGDVRRHFADISLAKELVGWQPKTKFEDGIKTTVEWYKKNLKLDTSIT